MKKRAVYSTPELAVTVKAMAAARNAGVDKDDISLVARSDISLEKIPDDFKEVSGDFYPAAIKGAVGGGVVGLLAGIVAVAVPAIGLTVAGAAVATLAGASLGAWATALAGSAVPDPVRRKFEGEIESGRILVVIDAEEEVLTVAGPLMAATGAEPLPFDQPSAMS